MFDGKDISMPGRLALPTCSGELHGYRCRNGGGIPIESLQGELRDPKDSDPLVTCLVHAQHDALLYKRSQPSVGGIPRANSQSYELLERQWLASFLVIAYFDNQIEFDSRSHEWQMLRLQQFQLP
jgi:hypothetical protein